MLVEDEADLIDIMARVLEEKEYAVNKTSSAEDAPQFCREHTRDLIISDVKMGEMGGFALLERIYSIAKLNHIPSIFLTALHRSFGVLKSEGAWSYWLRH